MSQPVCRLGDIGFGVCPMHDSPQNYITTFITTAVSAFSDGKGIAIVGTIGSSTCGHPTIALTGSGLSTANGKGIHRVGDTGANYGPYVAETGSPFVTSL